MNRRCVSGRGRRRGRPTGRQWQTRVNKRCRTRIVVDKKYFATLLVLDLPAVGQRLLRVGKHVEKLDEVFVVLVALVVDGRVGANLLNQIHEIAVLLEEFLGLDVLFD